MSVDEIADLEYNLKNTVSPFILIPFTEGLRLCMNAATKGHPEAMFELGYYYFYGYPNIIKRNVECALYMWRMASVKGHKKAKQELYKLDKTLVKFL